MIENFEAVIGANIREFQRDLAEVDAIIRETALGAEAMIGADISNFVSRAATVQATTANIASSSPTVNVNANTAGFVAQAATVQAATAAVASLEPTVTFDADTAVAAAQATGFIARLRAMTAQDFVVRMRTSWNNYQQVMGQMATFSRNFGEFAGLVGRGGMMLVSPAAIPVLASAAGLIGNLGPMLGTIGGSTFALGSAFGTAGIGAAAFGAIAVTNLKDIFGASEDLKKLDEKLAKADTWKEKLAIQKEIKQVQSSLNEEQAKGLQAMGKLKETWSGIAGALQSQTIQVFTASLGILSSVLTKLKPMFTSVMDAAKNLTTSLSATINAEPMKNFFNYLNTTAGPMFETITKSVGNFVQGFLNMMVAFGPLATETAGSFLKMSESFAAWGASLSNNQQFQAFTAYVSENMPKIRSIVGDAIAGVVNTFAAFGDSSSGMMTNLQNMMGRFREWSSALGESQGFKNFIDYIQTNGPVVVSTIGNIVDTLIEIGIALAPAGEAILGMADKFFAFTSKMLEAHPVIGRIGTALLILGGAFLMALPTVAALNALMGGLITTMIISTAKMTWAAAVQVAKWIWMGVTATAQAIVQAAAWTLATGVAMVTAVAKMIASAAVFVARWTFMGVQALLHAAKVAAGWTLATGAAMVTAVAKMIASAAVFVARWTLIGAKAMVQAAKVAGAWALSTGAALVTATAKMVASAAVFVARWTFMAVQSLAQAARMAAAWFIALGPVGWVTGAIIGLAVLIIANWDKISSWTKKTWASVASWISSKWSEIKTKTASAASGILSTVTNKFTSIVNSVQQKMQSAKTALSSKWDEAKAATSAKLSALVSAASTFFSNLVSKVKSKMAEAVVALGSKVAEMPGKVLSFTGAMLSAGADLVRGLINGIKNMAGSAIEAISGVVGGVISKAKSLLDINSPSRVFKAIGDFVGRGLALGVSSTQKMNEKVMTELGKVMTNVARANAQEIAKITAAAEKERAAAKKEHIAKEKEIERKAAEDIYQIKRVAESKKRKLTTSEVLRIEQIRRDSAAKIRKEEASHAQELAKIQNKASADIKKREAEVQGERMAAIQKFVDNKNKLEGLSAIQEANIWRRAADSFKEGTQEKIDAQSKYRDKLKQIQDDIESINSKYSQRMIDINSNLSAEIQRINDDLADKSKAAKDKLIEDEKRLNDAYSSALTDRYNTLKSFAGLFDKFESEPKETGTELLDNLQSQVDGFKSWESEISKLSTKGIDDGLLSELRDMGPKALPQLVALNSMTSEQLTQYSSLFREKSALARAEAEEQLAGMKADTQQQITELRAVTNAELTKLKNEARVRIVELRTAAKEELAVLKVDWANDIAALTKSTEEQFKPLSQIGKDAVAGLIKGMQSMKGPLAKEAQAIADAVQKTIKSALQIHSPSRVMATLGQYTGQGLVNGLSSMISDVMKVSSQLAHAIVPDIANVQMAGVDIRSDIANMKQQIRQELEVSMDVNHSGGVGSVGAVSGGDTYYVTVDAKNVKEFNDIVRLFDKQKRQSQ